jgi:chitin disaccharide deacetylase
MRLQSSPAVSVAKSPDVVVQAEDLTRLNSNETSTGVLIINADDWGRDLEATDRTLECVLRGTVSSVSAMVFMEDSERGAKTALEAGVDAGLHLNLTTPFSAPGCPDTLMKHHQKVIAYLRRNRLAQVFYHPGLRNSFQYVVAAQLDEYRRLYGKDPDRVDGHHHMHLCANVLYGGLLPDGVIARRNFSFQPGQKSLFNRLYRQATDRILARHHRMTDFFFSLPPLEPVSRLQHIFSLARTSVVEVETHPVSRDEYSFLMGEEILQLTANVKFAHDYGLPR